jgi:hypothetical protein
MVACGRWQAERELECETGMHARITQSHMEMQEEEDTCV